MGCFRQGNCMLTVTVLWVTICLSSIGDTQEGRRPPPRMGWGRRPYGFAVGIAPSADGALGRWEFRAVRGAGVSLAAASGYFARCGGRPEALPLDSAILGCTPPVGKSGRRGIFRQSKVWVRSHTGCMARNRTAAMAEKARRAPQTHGWRVALSEKNRVKLLTFFLFLTMARMGTAFTTAAAAPTGAADQHKEQPAHHQSHQKPVQPRHRTNPTI